MTFRSQEQTRALQTGRQTKRDGGEGERGTDEVQCVKRRRI